MSHGRTSRRDPAVHFRIISRMKRATTSLNIVLGAVVSYSTLLTSSAVAAPGDPATPPAAEAPAEADVPTAEADAQPAPAEPAAEEPEAEPTPPPPAPEPPKPEQPLFKAYGIIKPEFIVANGVETFGKTTMVAPTAAAHPISDPNHDRWAMSFQLQQTRVGLKVGEGLDVQGRLEIDFVDPAFSQSSPIQGTRPRLRLAYLTYKPGAAHTIMFGQNWDIFSPLNPLTMNLVGASFQAGNSAFLRPQLAYTYGKGEGIELSAAIGLRGQNTGPALNLLEYGLVPSFALQAGYRLGKSWFGGSVIFSSERTSLEPSEYNVAVAGNLFASLPLTDWLSLVMEGYIGRNTNALGLLTLGSGITVTDAGGFLSANFKFAKIHGVWVTVGGAGVLNPNELAVGYTPATAEAPAARVGIGGMIHNVNLRATYLITPKPGLDFYIEPFLFLTKHKLDVADDPTGDLENQTAGGGQLGAKYTF